MTSRFRAFAVFSMLCALPSNVLAQEEIRPPLHTSGYKKQRWVRKYGEVETYYLLSPDYRRIGAPEVRELLRTVENQGQ